MLDAQWALLIYTVPAEPSRKRAYVWREVKKVGAVYLRDGVCVLPERAGTVAALRNIAAKVVEFGGQATVILGARLDPEATEGVLAQSRAARADEYADIARQAEQLQQHMRHERDHREFSFAELEALEEDQGKLKRWRDQVAARDYFGAGRDREVEEILARRESELASFLQEVYGRQEARR